MAGEGRVTVAVEDRILLHLLEQDDQRDLFMVTAAVTRPGIAEACALHPPNVSRAMRNLLAERHVEEHTRTIRGESRRQKTWQLSEAGRSVARGRRADLAQMQVLMRNSEGKLLELDAGEAAERLNADLSLLQVLMHAQHEGVLTYGDIRFGPIIESDEDGTPRPGRIQLLTGAHATYHNAPPRTRTVHGRSDEMGVLDDWWASRTPCALIHGIAGIGKSTLASHWISEQLADDEQMALCWYPCQPWDSALGLATSLLHRVGIDEEHDPHGLMQTLPLVPGGAFDIDAYRRRLLAYLTDASVLRERFNTKSALPPYFLFVLDDVHHLAEEGAALLGALLQIAEQSPLRLLLISRTTLSFYDRRDVHIRERVAEFPLSGLSEDEVGAWMGGLSKQPSGIDAAEVHAATGGHPLAVELLEIFGEVTHEDWLRFLDEEILAVLPSEERELLATLAVAERPVPWSELASACDFDGTPPQALVERGLLIELPAGMWLHEALRERLLREVGAPQSARRAALDAARS